MLLKSTRNGTYLIRWSKNQNALILCSKVTDRVYHTQLIPNNQDLGLNYTNVVIKSNENIIGQAPELISCVCPKPFAEVKEDLPNPRDGFAQLVMGEKLILTHKIDSENWVTERKSPHGHNLLINERHFKLMINDSKDHTGLRNSVLRETRSNNMSVHKNGQEMPSSPDTVKSIVVKFKTDPSFQFDPNMFQTNEKDQKNIISSKSSIVY
ncbi:MAG: hypothetical protein MHPSP_001686, partial [Paramarteilia canceri]